MKKLISLLLVLCMVIGFSSMALAKVWDNEITVHALTRNTKWDGKRYSHTTEWQKYTATNGTVFLIYPQCYKPSTPLTYTYDLNDYNSRVQIPKKSENFWIEIISSFGSENLFSIEASNYIKVGFYYLPTKLRFRAHARSSKKPLGGRGSTKIKFHFNEVPIP
ncbi:hypothetical protein PV797_01210 [Clostridiaceae bacterium M8S5]|nr:hypothetical protein PV797_01210 [Clostridiaceae bacterium M8S5]